MNDTTPSLQVFNVALPEAAPRIRITAGLGSVTQKTWNLRRPVTLMGSRRPAHIVLHDRKISPAHCVIVNTGTEVLLKDLHTSAGTLCSGERVDLTVLKDGDTITLGRITIQVAIQVPQDMSADSGCGMEFEEPTAFRTPVELGLLHTQQRWSVKKAVELIGRHEAAKIFLDEERVSRRHAIIFRFKDGPAVFDIGGEGGIRVNGRLCSLAPLSDGDRITVGPLQLLVGSPEAAALDVHAHRRQMGYDPTSPASGEAPEQCERATPPFGADLISGGIDAPHPRSAAADAVDLEMDAIGESISRSWEQLNSWQSSLLDEATQLSKQGTDLAAREAELDAKDAAVRGRLHDVERLEERVAARERELNDRLARYQAEKQKLEEDQAKCAAREAEVARRAEELARREHVFAQRWSRLHGAVCSHCGKPFEPR